MSAALTVMRCRLSDRTPAGAFGARALGNELARRLGSEPAILGAGGQPRESGWEEDLRDGVACLRTADQQLAGALAAGRFPIILAGDCTICLATMPALARARPDARVLWIDAHGDFNLPDTTPSGFLGGMCLAGAVGAWEAGADPIFPEEHVVLAGGRDVDPGEREALERSGVRWVPANEGAEAVAALEGAPTYVHLDLDVLDPGIFPAQFPAPGGLSAAGLRDLLEEVADAVEVVGVEVTAFFAPESRDRRAELAHLAADAVEPLLPSSP